MLPVYHSWSLCGCKSRGVRLTSECGPCSPSIHQGRPFPPIKSMTNIEFLPISQKIWNSAYFGKIFKFPLFSLNLGFFGLIRAKAFLFPTILTMMHFMHHALRVAYCTPLLLIIMHRPYLGSSGVLGLLGVSSHQDADDTPSGSCHHMQSNYKGWA